ncbi:leukemia NUP98 fusion partner 1 isoform X1 [Malaclemys terrapin pileata]|uniref:leukemia NUP98 fusion partner 1 isoform X1 n=1 Tax=Malaclemys terrapin pileata TaxID=2991368 RepID=UPI0023A8080F|nr:leukemia NUP98 fusion partner 1 isoform X1 [Malaclemys terrapin pileata]
MPGRGQGEALPCAARPGSPQTRGGGATCRRSGVRAVPAPSSGLRHRRVGATCWRRGAKLSSIHMTRLHASTKTPSSGHLRGCKEFQEGQDVKCHCHTKACKISSPDGSGSTSRSNSIQEFSESFEKQLHFKIKRSVSLDEDSDPCVICHDDLDTGSIIELHCMHSFHKECIEKWLLKKPTCPTCRIHVLMSKSILDLHQPG